MNGCISEGISQSKVYWPSMLPAKKDFEYDGQKLSLCRKQTCGTESNTDIELNKDNKARRGQTSIDTGIMFRQVEIKM